MTFLDTLAATWHFLTTATRYTGADGIGHYLVQHVEYTVVSLFVAVVIAVPLGAVIGHTGRGAWFVVGISTALRALPSLGVVVLLVSTQGISATWLVVTLVILAVPPVMLGTLAGVAGVDPDVVSAARGVGMTGRQVLLQVELPNATPVLLGGVRTAALQIVATASIAAVVGLQGLGQLVINGVFNRDVPQAIAGAVLIALLAVVVDLVLAGVQRLVVPTGVQLLAGPRRTPALLRRGPAREGTPA